MTVAPARPRKESLAPVSSREEMDEALATLAAHKDFWTEVTVRERTALLDHLLADFAAVAEPWTRACLAAEGLSPEGPEAGEEWLAGPYLVLRNLRLLRRSLADIAARGRPSIPGPVTVGPDGQAVARVFPQTPYDRLFFPGVEAEVWMEPGVGPEDLAATQAVAYREPGQGAVAMILGAGNVSSIGPMDALYKLFVENQVVLYKAHPVNAYLGPLLEQGFRVLGEAGFFRLVYGGAQEGAYLVQHPAVDEVHITGSDRTYEAVVFGTGAEGARRKAQGRPRIAKRVTAELGNVSPVIVVPGPWRDDDLAYQAENLVSTLTNNAGFNCNATRVMVQHAGWPQRRDLLAALGRLLARVAPRKAWYPGAGDRFRAFAARHPEAETFGRPADGELPWALIPDLDPDAEDEICYTTEAFCGVFAETALEAATVPQFLERAVAFANRRLWGTLNATLVVHPQSLKDPEVAAAVARAVADLRYGSVTLNHWAAVSYGLVVTPWGAFPGQPPADIQSGTGVVHNTLMFSRAQKAVVRAPFRAWPKPPWFPTHRTAHHLARRLTEFEARPSPLKIPGILAAAMKG